MRRYAGLAITILALATILGAQDTPDPQKEPQTPREALIEMLTAGDARVFEHHLLNETQAKLNQLTGDLQQRVSSSANLAGGLVKSSGRDARWFPNGPMLFFAADPKTKSRVEVMIDKENLQGDVDDMELSIHTLNADQPSNGKIVPHLMVRMQSEAGVWKLAALGFSISVPLDAALVDSIAQKLKSAAQPAHVVVSTHSNDSASGQPALPQQLSLGQLSIAERKAVVNIHSLMNAEANYRDRFRQVGFTCALTDLGGQGYAQSAPDHALLIGSELENGAKDEYRFMLTDCNGTPAGTFKVIAIPTGSARHGRKAFCSDQTGAVHFAEDGSGVSCLREHNVLTENNLQVGN